MARNLSLGSQAATKLSDNKLLELVFPSNLTSLGIDVIQRQEHWDTYYAIPGIDLMAEELVRRVGYDLNPDDGLYNFLDNVLVIILSEGRPLLIEEREDTTALMYYEDGDYFILIKQESRHWPSTNSFPSFLELLKGIIPKSSIPYVARFGNRRVVTPSMSGRMIRNEWQVIVTEPTPITGDSIEVLQCMREIRRERVRDIIRELENLEAGVVHGSQEEFAIRPFNRDISALIKITSKGLCVIGSRVGHNSSVELISVFYDTTLVELVIASLTFNPSLDLK